MGCGRRGHGSRSCGDSNRGRRAACPGGPVLQTATSTLTSPQESHSTAPARAWPRSRSHQCLSPAGPALPAVAPTQGHQLPAFLGPCREAHRRLMWKPDVRWPVPGLGVLVAAAVGSVAGPTGAAAPGRNGSQAPLGALSSASRCSESRPTPPFPLPRSSMSTAQTRAAFSHRPVPFLASISHIFIKKDFKDFYWI